uniref:Uncharacterized protein n=1 Tax=Oncorhynchus tshawytscha TaxID=74940 RepID=A0AAZ3RU20_ONCTS
MQAITPTLLCYSTESVHQGPGQQLISRIRCAGKPTGGSSPGGGLLYRTLVVRSSPSDSFVKSESSLINWVLFLSVGGTAKGTLCGEPSAPLRRCQQPLLFPKNNETDEVITSINVPLGVEECQQANNAVIWKVVAGPIRLSLLQPNLLSDILSIQGLDDIYTEHKYKCNMSSV